MVMANVKFSRSDRRQPETSVSENFPKRSQLKKGTSEVNEIAKTYLIVPPDGGWGWVVVVTSFVCNFTCDGTVYTFGIFLNDIAKSIGCPPTDIALANSLMSGCYYLSGPFVGALTNRFGCRSISILGGLIAGISILITSFSTRLLTILLVYGIVGGIGFGMMYMPSIIAVGFYFERWRAIATSIAVCGSSLGITCFPLFFEELLYNSQWRVKFRYLSIACFVCACFSTLYRPLKPIRVVTLEDKKIQITNEKDSLVSFYTEEETSAKSAHSIKFSRYNNLEYPTTADIHGQTTVSLLEAPRTSSVSIVIGMTGPSTSTIRSGVRPRIPIVQSARLKTLYEEKDYVDSRCQRFCIKLKKCFCCCCRRSYYITPTRPLYRDDILYGGSLEILPEYKISVQSSLGKPRSHEKLALEYHLSVTRVTTQREIEEQHESCICCPESIKRTLATMLSMKLLKSPSFVLVSFSGFFTTLGLYTPFLFIAERAKRHEIEPKTAYYLISALGIANTIGRLGSGMLSTLPNANALICSYISLSIAGIATMASSLSFHRAWQFGYACIYGSTVACVAALRPIILVEMMGLEKLTNSFGISLLFQGVACLIGIPLSSRLEELTGTYELSFYFSGGVIFISALLLMFIKRVMKWELNREQRRANQ